MFYKREGKEKWKGPGKVVFQDGKVVFVRHGSVFVRVPSNRLCKISSVESDEDGSRLDIVSSGNDAGQLEHKDISYAENRELKKQKLNQKLFLKKYHHQTNLEQLQKFKELNVLN